MVPVVVDTSDPPDGLELGEITVDPAEVDGHGRLGGPSNRVVSARVERHASTPAGINIDRDVAAGPVDEAGEVVSRAWTSSPALVHVEIPVYTNLVEPHGAGQPDRHRRARPPGSGSPRSTSTRWS